MKTKFLFILFFVLIYTNSFSQEERLNYINGKINVPIIIDETTIVDDLNYNQFDKTTKYQNKKYEINTSLNRIPVTFSPSGNYFRGMLLKKDNSNFITKIIVSGFINIKKNISRIEINESLTKKDNYYQLNFETTYRYEGLKVNKGTFNSKDNKKITTYTFLPKESANVSVKKYTYWERSSGRKRITTHEIVFVKVDEEKLEEKMKPGYPYFSSTVYWDGTTIENIIAKYTTITQVRGEDLNWQPPSANYIKEGIEAEPNSIGIYANYYGLNDESKMLTKGNSALLIANFSKVPGLKILERGNIDKIINEIKLSESSLVEKESKIENKLMKEEMAVVIKTDLEKKIIECTIMSKNKEIKIKSTNYTPNRIFDFLTYYEKIILKEINKQFTLKVDAEKTLFPSYN